MVSVKQRGGTVMSSMIPSPSVVLGCMTCVGSPLLLCPAPPRSAAPAVPIHRSAHTFPAEGLSFKEVHRDYHL